MNEETIGLELNGSKGYFYVSADGKQEGKMTFVFAGNGRSETKHRITIDKTINQFPNWFPLNTNG